MVLVLRISGKSPPTLHIVYPAFPNFILVYTAYEFMAVLNGKSQSCSFGFWSVSIRIPSGNNIADSSERARRKRSCIEI